MNMVYCYSVFIIKKFSNRLWCASRLCRNKRRISFFFSQKKILLPFCFHHKRFVFGFQCERLSGRLFFYVSHGVHLNSGPRGAFEENYSMHPARPKERGSKQEEAATHKGKNKQQQQHKSDTCNQQQLHQNIMTSSNLARFA